MKEALNLYIEEPENSRKLAPLPDDSIALSHSIVEVQVRSQEQEKAIRLQSF